MVFVKKAKYDKSEDKQDDVVKTDLGSQINGDTHKECHPREGYSTALKIYRLAAYEQARRALRLKYEPSFRYAEAGENPLPLCQINRDTHEECPYLFGAEGGIRTLVCFWHKLISSQPRYDHFDTSA